MPGKKRASYHCVITPLTVDPTVKPMASACMQPATKWKPWRADISRKVLRSKLKVTTHLDSDEENVNDTVRTMPTKTHSG